MKTARAFFIAIILMATLVNIANAASTEDCKECHEDEYEAWSASAHYNDEEAVSDKTAVITCVPCHAASAPRLYSI
ncbi:NapC/NirT family cytochrome c [Methanolobus bombayensis]|uniref:NapC/NirT family cytochrome c n=1 Tax=Methanolobus bombayensis TaxID=38023 RepID=UPI001AE1B4B7|nr:NapC/NirT family cytochrome c [Methanolobus bombayensis]MBP1908944.1 nitrate/TMAO reductase-like tetraheme cytochrome c subunit [Methanolobus bombayensis]